MDVEKKLDEILPANFSNRFMKAYLGSVIGNPSIAMIEVVANSWDAGAMNVDITWPNEDEEHGLIKIVDDGCGLSDEEFKKIWPTASYDRSQDFGTSVILPNGVERTTFGRNGIGRFGMFFFSDSYTVETWKDGKSNIYAVKLANPYSIEHIVTENRSGHGTIITCTKKGIVDFITAEFLSQQIRNKFYDGHDFHIKINGIVVDLSKNDPIKKPESTNTEYGEIIITRYSAEKNYKGILFRVCGRPVGEPSWNLLEEVDSRRNEFKFLLTVDVDFLKENVLPDWTGFEKGEFVDNIMSRIRGVVRNSMSDIFDAILLDKKTGAIRANLTGIRQMSTSSRGTLGEVLDKLLETNPNITNKDIENVARVIISCDNSKSKYDLMDKLAKVDSTDIDSLNEVLNSWSIKELKVVYDELNGRIETVSKLEKVINNKDTDELHVLQPIFENNLWFFGPEYDSCSFMGNKALSTVLRKMFDADGVEYDRRRLDVIALPNSTISIRSADGFDSDSEVNGYSKILIIELKKGGFTITEKEKNQAKDYALYIRNSGKVGHDVPIICYVLGAMVDPRYEDEGTSGTSIRILPMAYDIIIRRAKQRLFNLVEKMKLANPEVVSSGDSTIDDVLKSTPSINIFDKSDDISD